MPDEIPKIDPDLDGDEATRNIRRENIEFEQLEAEAAFKRMAHREVGQRFYIRWVAVVTGVVVTIGMAFVLWHSVHNIFIGPVTFVGPALSVAMIVTPIFSITSITVALFVGAFRKFEEKDLESIGNGIVGAANYVRSG